MKTKIHHFLFSDMCLFNAVKFLAFGVELRALMPTFIIRKKIRLSLRRTPLNEQCR